MTALQPAEAARRSGQARISVVTPSDLTEAQEAAWRRFQTCDPALGSPYLTPDFIRIAAEVLPAVRVATTEHDGRPVGFFPFERRPGRVGRPVGGPLSDCQAVITDPAWHWNARDLVRDCGLSVFDFTHLRASQPHFAPYHRTVVASHAIDLSMGFDAYLRERREARGPDVTYGRPHHAAARLRALEKQMGPVRFELHDPDSEALRLLLGWKSQQYRKNGVPDAFSCSWCVALVERLHRHQSQHLAGMLSTLTAGGRIVAAHMGMRSPTVLHWWFPSYDPAFAKFSPGLILLTEVCRRAREDGVQLVELGAGDEPYKRQVANTSIPEASGFVGIPSAQTLLRRLCHGTEELAARLPLGPASHWPAKALRRIEKFRRYS